MPASDLLIRCKACTERFPVQAPERAVTCPRCGQGWKLRWFGADQPMIIAPASWRAYQQRTLEQWG